MPDRRFMSPAWLSAGLTCRNGAAAGGCGLLHTPMFNAWLSGRAPACPRNEVSSRARNQHRHQTIEKRGGALPLMP